MVPEIKVDGTACLAGALLLLILPAKWLAGAFAAAMIHELCHWGMILLAGGCVYSLRIGLGGAGMETSPLTDIQELLCALAGPMGSFLLVSFRRIFPQTAVCALVQGTFNLLPLYPMDGARILRCGAALLLPQYADGIIKISEAFTIAGLAVGGTCLFLEGSLGFGPLILTGIVILKGILRKIPCKAGRVGVQ